MKKQKKPKKLKLKLKLEKRGRNEQTLCPCQDGTVLDLFELGMDFKIVSGPMEIELDGATYVQGVRYLDVDPSVLLNLVEACGGQL